jgi:hypothetical protein
VKLTFSRLTADEIREWMVNPAEMTKKAKAERKPPMKAWRISMPWSPTCSA